MTNQTFKMQTFKCNNLTSYCPFKHAILIYMMVHNIISNDAFSLSIKYTENASSKFNVKNLSQGRNSHYVIA